MRLIDGAFRSNGSLVLLIRLFGELATPVKLVNALILTSYRMNPGLTRFIAETNPGHVCFRVVV
jgi:hypothetical protein